ncbi:MAG: pLS20_p028 family conjugation system transmembrane protein [Clostridium sp.]
MSDAQVIEILKSFDVLNRSSIWADAFRFIMWHINLGLSKVVDLLSNSLSEIYSVMNFFNSKYVNDFIDKYIVVIFAFASIALAILGWKIIIKKENDYNKIITNALIAITIFVVLPWGMQQGESLVKAGVNLLDGNVSKSTKIFSSNITDLYLIDKNGWKNQNPQPKNYIKDDSSLSFLSITEIMDTGGLFTSTKLSDDGTKILKHKISDASGEYKLEELKSHLVYEDEGYYRYSWHPFFILIELGTMALVLFFTCFKTAQLIQELGILKIIVQGTALTDIETGQRNKKLIEKVKNTFIILYIIMLLLNIYLLFVDFVTASKISKATQLVMILASGILVIDGPNFIEEMFGIDAGLKSISRSIIATAQGAKGIKDFASAIGKGASAVGKASVGASKVLGKTAINTSAGIKGALDGFKESGNSSKEGNSSASPLGGMSNGNASQDDKVNSPLSDISKSNVSQGDTETTGDAPLGGMSNGSTSNDIGATGDTPLGSMSNSSTSNDMETTGDTPLGGMSNSSTSNDMETTGDTPLGSMSNGSTSNDIGTTGNTPLGSMSNGSTSNDIGATGDTPLGGMSNSSTSNDMGTTGDTPLGGMSNGSTSNDMGTTGDTPLGSMSNGSTSNDIGATGNTPLGSASGSSTSKGSTGTNTPLGSASGSSTSKGSVGVTTPIGNASGSSVSKGGVGVTTPIGNTSGSSISKGSVGATTPIGNASGSSVSKGSVGVTAPIGSASGSSISNSNVGVTTPIGNTSGSSVSKGGVGATAPIGSASGSSISKGSVGVTAPIGSASGSSISKGSVGVTASIPSSLRPNTSKIYKPSTVKLPKDVEIKPIEKPTSKTITDIAVSKYANMAEKIYNSPTLKGARNTYQVSKNSAMALKNNKEKDDNEKRD